jgi:transglutaminase-like putative cysteine protease
VTYGSPTTSYPTPEERNPRRGAARDAAVSIRRIPDGYDGTAAIVAEMRRLALGAFRDERINRLARAITGSVAARDFLGEVDALLEWMQETFRYTRLPWHPSGLQRLQTPGETLFEAPSRTGECASLATALAALLMSLGFEVMFRTAGTDALDPRFFEHVYVMVNVPGHGWLAADASYPHPLGWEHEAIVTTEDWTLR